MDGLASSQCSPLPAPECCWPQNHRGLQRDRLLSKCFSDLGTSLQKPLWFITDCTYWAHAGSFTCIIVSFLNFLSIISDRGRQNGIITPHVPISQLGQLPVQGQLLYIYRSSRWLWHKLQALYHDLWAFQDVLLKDKDCFKLHNNPISQVPWYPYFIDDNDETQVC